MSVEWAHLVLLVMFGLVWVCLFQLVGRDHGTATKTAKRKTATKRPLGKL
jgi:hypothetical protein